MLNDSMCTWTDGVNVQAVVYEGPSLAMAIGLVIHLEKSIGLETHIPFLEGDGKYVVATSVDKLDLPDGKYQVFMKGVIKEETDEE